MMAIPFFVKAAESTPDPASSASQPVAEEGVDFKQCMKDLADGEVFAGEEGTPQAPRETAAEAPNDEAPALDGERPPAKRDPVAGDPADSHENEMASLADQSAEPAPLPAEIVEMIEMYFPLYEGEPASEQPVVLSMSEDCEEPAEAEVPESAAKDSNTEAASTPAQAGLPKQPVVAQTMAEVEAGQAEPVSNPEPVVAQATPGDVARTAEPVPLETGSEQAPQAEVSRDTADAQPEQAPLTEAEPVKHEAVGVATEAARVPVESAQVPAESSVVSEPAAESSPMPVAEKPAETQDIPVTTPEPVAEPSTGTVPTEGGQPVVAQSEVEPEVNREGMEQPVEPVVREAGTEVASQPVAEAPVRETVVTAEQPSEPPREPEADVVRIETDARQPELSKVNTETPEPSREEATDQRPEVVENRPVVATEVDGKRPTVVTESPEADVAAMRKETIEVETGREDSPRESGSLKSEMVERDTPVEVPEGTKGLAADLAAAGEAKRPASEGTVAKPVESQNFLENKAVFEGEDRVVSDLLEADGRTQQAVQPDAKTAETQAATGMEATVENKAERTIAEPVREDAATVEAADAVRTPVDTSTGEQGESGLGDNFERKYTPPQRKVGADAGEAFSAVTESSAASTSSQPITAARIANGEATVERAEQFQQVLERLDRAVLDAATESDHTMTITLLPRELGRLVLNCEEHQGQMTVELVAEDGQVCQTLREQETALRDMLQQSGYELSRFDVRDQRGGQQERGTFEQARDRTPRRRQAGRVEAETATEGARKPVGAGSGSGVWYVA